MRVSLNSDILLEARIGPNCSEKVDHQIAAMANSLKRGSAAGDDLYDLQAITIIEREGAELRGGNSFTVVFHDDAFGKLILADKEFLHRAWELRRDLFSVGNNGGHLNRRNAW